MKIDQIIDRIYFTIRSENVESGMYSRAFYEFREFLREDSELAQSALLKLLRDHQSSPHIVEGILHLCCGFDYLELTKITKPIIDLTSKYFEPVVQTKFISLCEDWVCQYTLNALIEMKPYDKFVEEYQIAVIQDMKEALDAG